MFDQRRRLKKWKGEASANSDPPVLDIMTEGMLRAKSVRFGSLDAQQHINVSVSMWALQATGTQASLT